MSKRLNASAEEFIPRSPSPTPFILVGFGGSIILVGNPMSPPTSPVPTRPPASSVPTPVVAQGSARPRAKKCCRQMSAKQGDDDIQPYECAPDTDPRPPLQCCRKDMDEVISAPLANVAGVTPMRTIRFIIRFTLGMGHGPYTLTGIADDGALLMGLCITLNIARLDADAIIARMDAIRRAQGPTWVTWNVPSIVGLQPNMASPAWDIIHSVNAYMRDAACPSFGKYLMGIVAAEDYWLSCGVPIGLLSER